MEEYEPERNDHEKKTKELLAERKKEWRWLREEVETDEKQMKKRQNQMVKTEEKIRWIKSFIVDKKWNKGGDPEKPLIPV